MDREFSLETLRKRRWVLAIKIAVPLVLVFTAIAWGAGWLAPTLERSRIRTAVIERGNVEGAIDASGTVVPEFDAVITSPVEARVLRILKHAGDSVGRGESILMLDAGASALALDKLKDNIALKANQQAQLGATLEARLIKFDNDIRIKRREIESDSNRYEQNQRLFEKNYVSRTDLNQFAIQYSKAKDELDALLKEQRNAQTASRLQQEGIALEIAMLNKEKIQSQQELERVSAKAEHAGIVTWIVQTEGSTLHKGDVMAKVADLSTFRVDAQVSDVHRSRLAVGMLVKIKAGEQYIEGIIATIQPAIENGVVKFAVALTEKSHSALRSNLRVDVYVVTAQKNNVLRIKKGAFARGEGRQEVFVVVNDGGTQVAERRLATLGISNADYYEVVEGLQSGDEVIISDMQEHLHLKTLKIRN